MRNHAIVISQEYGIVKTGESLAPDPLRGIGSVMSVYARSLGEFPPHAPLRKACASRLISITPNHVAKRDVDISRDGIT